MPDVSILEAVEDMRAEFPELTVVEAARQVAEDHDLTFSEAWQIVSQFAEDADT